jgi:hypothetical protein
MKPMIVSDLKIRVVQQGSVTQANIVRASSKDIILSGAITLNHWRVVQDNIRVKLSTAMLLRAIF